ncbi:hypothetical protein [Methanocella sp. MCL-LM]|uniref:hypothetical protein n=1 Tax=Methanocella sp. MCL-LM TaxID=3412035 RepID=UPI003C766B12
MSSKIFIKDDDSGVSVLIEYVFLMTITAVMFSIFIMVLYTTFISVDRVVIGNELGIVSNDVASRISGFSNEVYTSQYSDSQYTSDVRGSAEYIELPGLVNGQQYKVSVTYDPATKSGTVNIGYQSEITLSKSASFHSDVSVRPVSLYSPSQSIYMYYDSVGNQIVLEGV